MKVIGGTRAAGMTKGPHCGSYSSLRQTGELRIEGEPGLLKK